MQCLSIFATKKPLLGSFPRRSPIWAISWTKQITAFLQPWLTISPVEFTLTEASGNPSRRVISLSGVDTHVTASVRKQEGNELWVTRGEELMCSIRVKNANPLRQASSTCGVPYAHLEDPGRLASRLQSKLTSSIGNCCGSMLRLLSHDDNTPLSPSNRGEATFIVRIPTSTGLIRVCDTS